ncbi:MAG TPA: tyrosine-type recombinase/integrase [Pyrinomonadaceae bacterium]|nr:tyrosine-type recombinase/integrase [Pyrinomonadaceae bacterium]
MAGQIVKRGDNKWLVRIYIGRGANNKRKYQNKLIHGTKKDAQTYLNARLREKDLGILAESANLTLNDFLDRWLETAVKPRVSLRTADNYRFLLDKYIREPLGNIKLENLSTMEIQKTYAEMQSRGLTARTVRHAHTTLKGALSQAIKWNILQRNVADFCELPKVVRKEKRVFSPDEAKRFLLFAEQIPKGLILQFALLTGMRPEEYLGLQWKDIDFERNTAQVRRALIRHKRKWYFETPKTAKSNRIVSLPEDLTEKLKAHKRKQNERRMKNGLHWENLDLVFCSRDGSPICRRNLTYRYYRPIIENAGLTQIPLYHLRHTHATLLLIAGVNPKIVSERLGHSSVVLTLDTYSHVLPSMQETAIEKLNEMLADKRPKNVIPITKKRRGTL